MNEGAGAPAVAAADSRQGHRVLVRQREAGSNRGVSAAGDMDGLSL